MSPADQAQNPSIDELFDKLHTSPNGLSTAEARQRLSKYGHNALEEKKPNPLRDFLRFFWGPIPWMIEVAAVLSAAVGHWADLAITLALLVLNAVIGFWQAHQAANAVAALERQLALKARVKRDGKWTEVDGSGLVPGDVVRVRAGDIIPADTRLLDGDYLSVDQSALTGESLPVDKKKGDLAYSSSVAKQGEMTALVVGTGANTYFGKTAALVSTAQSVSHFQKAVLTIGDYLIYVSLGLASVLLLTMLFRGERMLTIVQFVLILIVASIPVAMPAVLSVTMAIGASALAKMKAIVSRLECIEEMAGMDILCSDKTGTLTQNELTLGMSAVFAARDAQELVLTAALASKAEDRDPIDMAVLHGVTESSRLSDYHQTGFTPFDPVHKRTEASIQSSDGESFMVSKGAPQVILDLCHPPNDVARAANAKVEDFAGRGFRTLGVARREGTGPWQFLGLLSLFDPPRPDSAETIREATAAGIEVKMVTGDDTAIGRQIAGQLGSSADIRPAGEFFKGLSPDAIPPSVAAAVEAAGGFARVFPEDKFLIVKALQNRGHIVGMTGDGVNDAPALKQANTGIAVSGATDAARAAAALVLTAPGLSVIVRAVETARQIFERMNSYAIYRITETIRVMFFVVLAMLCFNFYPITSVMIILLALLNDLPIMTIAYDNTWLDPKPVRWDMRRVLSVATVLGLIGVAETFAILIIARDGFHLDVAEIQSFIYLKLAVSGHMTLMVARTRRSFLTRPYPAPILLVAILGTQLLAASIVGFGLLVTPIAWKYVGFVWLYALAFALIEDWAKLQVYRHLALSGTHHRRFLEIIKKPLPMRLVRKESAEHRRLRPPKQQATRGPHELLREVPGRTG